MKNNKNEEEINMDNVNKPQPTLSNNDETNCKDIAELIEVKPEIDSFEVSLTLVSDFIKIYFYY